MMKKIHSQTFSNNFYVTWKCSIDSYIDLFLHKQKNICGVGMLCIMHSIGIQYIIHQLLRCWATIYTNVYPMLIFRPSIYVCICILYMICTIKIKHNKIYMQILKKVDGKERSIIHECEMAHYFFYFFFYVRITVKTL